MFGLQKNNTAAILFTAFIASFITVACYFIFPKLQKFKADIISTETVPDEFHLFEDLNSDHISEKIRFHKNFMGKSAFLIEEKDKLIYQHNFEGIFIRNKFYHFDDYNNDGLKEIYIFTYKKDSAFLSIIEGTTDRIIINEKFITTFLYHAELPDFHVTYFDLKDFDNDGYKDLFLNMHCAFSYKTRKMAIYNIAKEKLIQNTPVGVAPINKIYFSDINNDGVPEIFGDFPSFGNSPADYLYSDQFLWIYTFDSNFNLVYPPKKTGNYPGIVKTRPLLLNGKNKIAVLSCHMGNKGDSTFVAILSPNGNIDKKRNLKINGTLPGFHFFTDINEGKGRITLFSNNGTIQEFDGNLNIIKEKGSFEFRDLITQIDVDKDNVDELFFSSKNYNLIIVRNDLSNPVFLPIKITADYHFSLEETISGKTYINIQVADTLYKIDYHKTLFYPFRYFIYFLIWTAAFLTFHIIGKVYKKIASRRYESEKQMATLQITAIENQLNPHFNLNILNSIGTLYETQEKEKAQYYLGKYSKLLRNLLLQSGKISVTVEEELEFTGNYLELEKLRMNNSFEYSVSGEKDYLNIEIPKMLIHTFCENSVKHGLRHLTENGKLDIEFFAEKNQLKIFISDNGVGRAKAKQYSLMSTGKGLEIINQTLELHFKLKHVKINYNISDIYNERQNVVGTKVEITVPL